MELFHSFSISLMTFSPTAFFYFKFSVVLFLFILNIYLIFTAPSNPLMNNQRRELQSGLGNRNLKGFLNKLATFGGFLSAFITVKNELKNIQIGKIDQLIEADRENIRRSIDKDREVHQEILSSVENGREELLNLHIEKAKVFAHNDRLLTLHGSIKDKVQSYLDKSTEPSTKLSDLGILDQLIKLDTEKFSKELDSLTLAIDPSSSSSSSTLKENELPTQDITDNLKDSSLKESSAFNFNILTSIDWFEGLNGIKKIAVSMILGKSVIFSALLSIIFVFYGNILIEKYDIENRYPKLAKLIQLRQKYQKYYFKYYCYLIISIIVIEVVFALAILTL